MWNSGKGLRGLEYTTRRHRDIPLMHFAETGRAFGKGRLTVRKETVG